VVVDMNELKSLIGVWAIAFCEVKNKLAAIKNEKMASFKDMRRIANFRNEAVLL